MQYGLVGLALALFFALLVSLSEHIGFTPAYGLAALYGILFLLLRSEDYALLMGSVFLFVLLAALMLGTRRVDWYALTPGFGKSQSALGQ